MGAGSRAMSWLPLLATAVCGCIVSTAGLTGAGPDSGPHDPTDGSSDGGGDSGGADTAGDAPAMMESGPSTDGGTEAGCVPPPLDGGPRLTCPQTDAGADGSAACSAASLPSFQPQWIPPNPPQNVCTATQISTLITCLSTSSAMCTTFTSDQTNHACISCMVSPLNAASYGPILLGNGISILNVGGCIALKEPCLLECAKASLAGQQCHTAACTSCPLTSQTDEQAYLNCTTASDMCSCAPEHAENETCSAALLGTPAASCVPSGGFTAGAQSVGMFFCGGGP
jgi:hypothetical protein